MTAQQSYEQIAISLGYDPNDLLPINYSDLRHQHLSLLAKMTIKQQQYFLNKKMQLMQDRQLRIIKEIANQINKRSKLHFRKVYHRQGQNPLILKLFQQHKKIMDRKTKYFETILKIKAKDMLEKCDQEEFDARSNKSDSAPRSKKLRSRRNNNSDAQDSEIDSRPKSTHGSISNIQKSRLKLIMVQNKRQQQQRQRRSLFALKKQQRMRKSLKVCQTFQNKSLQLRQKSLSARKTIDQNRKKLHDTQQLQIQAHLSLLDKKIAKTQQIRNKQRKLHSTHSTHPTPNTIQIRKTYHNQHKMLTQSHYYSKHHNANLRLQQKQQQQQQYKSQHRLIYQHKLSQIHNNKTQNDHKIHNYNTIIMNKTTIQQQKAQQIRQKLKYAQKNRIQCQILHHQLAEKNRKDIQVRRAIQIQQCRRKNQEKIEEIRKIQRFQRKLLEDRQGVQRDMKQAKRRLETAKLPRKKYSYKL